MSERLSYPVEIMAKLLQLTPRRVQQLANEGVIHKTERGRYDLIKSVQGYITYLNDQIPNKTTSDNALNGGDDILSLKDEQAKYIHNKAQLSAIELQEKRGQLVYAADQRKDAFQIARTVRNNMLNIPPRVAQDLAIDSDPNSIHRKLETELIAAMTEIAEVLEQGKSSLLPFQWGADCEYWHLVVADQEANG